MYVYVCTCMCMRMKIFVSAVSAQPLVMLQGAASFVGSALMVRYLMHFEVLLANGHSLQGDYPVWFQGYRHAAVSCLSAASATVMDTPLQLLGIRSLCREDSEAVTSTTSPSVGASGGSQSADSRESGSLGPDAPCGCDPLQWEFRCADGWCSTPLLHHEQYDRMRAWKTMVGAPVGDSSRMSKVPFWAQRRLLLEIRCVCVCVCVSPSLFLMA